ncbi:MAG TPA: molybdenum cofactor guanylyltransferase [Gemmatimonadaceae bacterium]
MLAGGASRRFGGAPKGLNEINGKRIVDRVADALRWVTPNLTLVSNSADAQQWLPGVAVLRDRVSDAGGLAGVDAALATGNDVLIVAWDMPFVTPDLFQLILAKARNEEADVVVPESGSPHGFEPFCSFYSARVAGALERYLTVGSTPSDFLADIPGVSRLTLEEVGRVGDPARLFMSVNSAEDLARARAMAEMPE